jgi:CheY-like chemotaxis protein
MNAVAQPTVLVVDDDDYSQELACLTLGKLGFTQVQTAADGKAGLRTLDNMPQSPDFVICDIFMPEKDGIEVVAELGTRGYRGGLILVSGGDAQMLSIARNIAVASGLNVLGAFTKPLRLCDLAQAISASASNGTSPP